MDTGSSYSIINADVLDGLAQLDDGSVQTCVTSPPYWGLRDYGTARWEGGSPKCSHQKPCGGVGAASAKQLENKGSRMHQYPDICAKCGAKCVDSQLGLERTPDEYVEHMVRVFREVRRTLKDDGTLWLNLGDCYASTTASGGQNCFSSSTLTGGKGMRDPNRALTSGKRMRDPKRTLTSGLKTKDLVGIPWRVAFALQVDGWYLRQDIIWHKTNPMPESVRDRCTKAHEYIFLLSKQARYWYDHDAVKENAIYAGDDRGARLDVRRGTECNLMSGVVGDFRNKRSVWTVATQPFSEAHFATFPPKLIEPCILAGCPEGGTVLDPFTGSGTTGMVALRHGRQFVGIELNSEYVDMAHRRIQGE